jgi:hypothetical protein
MAELSLDDITADGEGSTAPKEQAPEESGLPLDSILADDEEGSTGTVTKLFSDAADTALNVLDIISEPGQRQSADTAKFVGLGDNEPLSQFEATGSFIPAMGDAYKDAWNKGLWSSFMLTLSAGEQAVARTLVNQLENFNLMDTSQAKQLLSRTILHPSDVMNIYWREDIDDPAYIQASRFVAGLGLDIFLDPLTYLGPVAPLAISTKAGRRFVKFGNTTHDIAKFSQAERQQLLFVDEMRHIIKSDLTYKMNQINLRNQMDNISYLSNFMSGKMTQRDLIGRLTLTDESRLLVEKARKDLNTKKGLLREFQDGDRLIQLGFKIPFTDMGFEIPMVPLTSMARAGSKVMLNIANSDVTAGINEAIRKGLMSAPGAANYAARGVNFTTDVFKNIWTKTGYPLFDERLVRTFGDTEAYRFKMAEFARLAHESFNDLDDKARDQILKDVVDEIEFGYSSRIELLQQAGRATTGDDLWFKPFDRVGDGPEVVSYLKDGSVKTVSYTKIKESELFKKFERNVESQERLNRINKNPNARKLVDTMRQENELMLEEYRRRGIPLKELNPATEHQLTGYLKHMVTEDYLKIMRESGELAEQAIKFLASSGKKIDTSARLRTIRDGINNINEESLKKYGVKMFIDDPIELHARRQVEMRNVINNFDLMQEASNLGIKSKKHPGLGWVKFDEQELQKRYTSFVKSFKPGEKPETIAQEFYPNFYRLKDGEAVYLPAAVHDRVTHALLNPISRATANPLLRGMSAMNRVFYNNALFGPGYLGLNMMSNVITLMTAGINPGRMLDSVKVLLDPSTSAKINIIDARTGKEIAESTEKIFTEGAKFNLWGTGISNLEWIDMTENMGGAYRLKVDGAIPYANIMAKGMQDFGASIGGIAQTFFKHGFLSKEFNKEFGTAFDYAFLWRANRFVAQHSDDVAKMTVFIDRLKKGYSYPAAAEAAERYFYNYRNISSRLRTFNKAVPFSTFPVKTMELIGNELKRGNLKSIAIPLNAKSHIEGAYVQDYETRKELDRILPSYFKNMDLIHGPILAGQREVLIEAPWAGMTLSMWAHGDMNLHPFVKAASGMYSWLVSETNNEGEPVEGELNQFPYSVGQMMDGFIPPSIKTLFGLMEINGKADFGGFFADTYLSSVPTPGEEGRLSSKAFKYDNAVEFGKYLAGNEDFLYRSLFADDMPVTEKLTPEQEAELSKRGEFIRRHFRSITFGLARMTKLDSNFMVNRGALNRQLRKHQELLRDQVANRHGKKLINTSTFMTKEERQKSMRGFSKKFLEENKDFYPAAQALIELEKKKFELDTYYNLVLMTREKWPDEDIFQQIFGIDEYRFNFDKYGEANREYKNLRKDIDEGFGAYTPENRLDLLLAE